MCQYVSGESLAPGWGCCLCSTYNGLQRPECRRCGVSRHEVVVPDDVETCGCGFGFPPGNLVTTLSGRDVRGRCPSCGAPRAEARTVS